MRLYTFELKKQQRIGAEMDGRLVDLNAAHAARLGQIDAVLATSMLDLIQVGESALRKAKQSFLFAQRNPQKAKRFTHDLDEVKLLAPIPRPGKILCSGLNYRSHVE